jgi:hypothetical protein
LPSAEGDCLEYTETGAELIGGLDPRCAAAGVTLDEARDMAGEALALHLAGLAEDGDAIPEPSSLEQVMADVVNRDGVAVLVSAPEVPIRAVRVNITLPADVLEAVDKFAAENGYSRSGFLVHAARRALAA